MTTTTRHRPRPPTARLATLVGRVRRGPAALIRQPRLRFGTVPPTFTLLLALIVVLNLVGLVMVLSASSVNGLSEYGSSWYHVKRQAIWATMGVSALLVTVLVDYRRWRRLATFGLVITFLLLLAVLVPGVSTRSNGASRWLSLGPINVQPAELAKLTMLVFVADLLARRIHRIDETAITLRPVLVVTGSLAVLVMLQPDLGTTILIGAVMFTLLFIAGVPLKELSLTALVGGGGAMAAAIVAPYRRNRMLAFIDPWDDPLNTSYQTIQSLVGIANGGVGGVGLGSSRAKWGFLPEAHTDFIFAIVAEELGLVGAMLIIGMFLAIGLLGFRTALRAPEPFGMLLAAGVTSWLLVQAFVNIGAVVGVLPITGMPMPFVSFGGSSLVVTMTAAGMLLNIARQSG